MLIIFLLYAPKRYFFDVNVGKLEESSCATLQFRRVCLWRHNHFTCETGRVACHPPPWMTGWSFWANRVDSSLNMGEWPLFPTGRYQSQATYFDIQTPQLGLCQSMSPWLISSDLELEVIRDSHNSSTDLGNRECARLLFWMKQYGTTLSVGLHSFMSAKISHASKFRV